jgi:hypothetical protein
MMRPVYKADGSKPKPQKKSTQRSRQARDISATPPLETGRNAIMPKGSNKLTLLPSVILSLKKKYFATLFSALDASERPFDHFTKTSPKLLEVSRQAFKSVWPYLKITLEADDVLFNVVSLSIVVVELGLSFGYRATNV